MQKKVENGILSAIIFVFVTNAMLFIEFKIARQPITAGHGVTSYVRYEESIQNSRDSQATPNTGALKILTAKTE